MLSTPAPFPEAGATAFLKPEALACKILRRHADGTALISLTDKRFPREIASGTPTVPLADLFETAEAALHPPVRPARTPRTIGPGAQVATADEAIPPAPPAAVATPRKRRNAR